MTTFRDDLVPLPALRAAQCGDRAAQERIYRSYVTPVYALARRLLADDGLAEEATQDVFLDVLTRLRDFRFDGAFAGWLRTLAVNRILMLARRRRVFGRHEDLAGGVDPDSLHAQHASADSGLDLEAALRLLSPSARAVVWLHEVEGYGHAEIAALLERSESYSKSQLARAYDVLRKNLGPELAAARGAAVHANGHVAAKRSE